MFLSMNDCKCMLNKNRFKDIGNFLLKLFMSSHVKEMHWMTPKILNYSAPKFREFCGPKQKSLSYKFAEI